MGSQPRRVWIFANGEIPDLQRLSALLEAGDSLYAADGGQRHLAQLERMPERLIGDLDSVSPEEVERLEKAGVRVERYLVDKDETDLELALDRAVAEGFEDIRIAGSLGGRLDQILGNLFLLQKPDLAGLDVRLEDGLEEVFLIDRQAQIHGSPGDTVSLLPINGLALGVTTLGLKYLLNGETLYPQKTRGISNVLLGTQAEVRLTGGRLICVHRRI